MIFKTIKVEKYVILNVLCDTGACGSILDKRTCECYKFQNLQPRNMTIKTVMGTKKKDYERNMLTAMTPEVYPLNLETITIGDIVYTKRDSEEYIQAICGEFGWDAKVKEHFMIDQNDKSKKIHPLLGLKNCGHMMEPVRRSN